MVYSACVLFVVTTILVTHPVPSSSQSSCPSKCNCIWRNGKQTTNCAAQGLISIPSGIQASTQVLDLNSNNFHVLPAKVFQERGLINLQKVFLSRCKLGVIAKDALIQLTNLVELDLSANLLTTVPSDSFEATPNLRRLVLNNNPIAAIRSNTFALTPNLNFLDLSECQIDSIEAGSFKGMGSLQYLKLEGNRLSTISFLVLQDLPPLYSMDLHKNPWNCDCLLRPAREWMLRNNVPQSIPPTCLGPEKLSGMMWNSLELDEFACAPAILSRDTDITAMIGTNASFTCITRAQPEAKVSWLIEDVIYRNLSSPVTSMTSASSSSSSSLSSSSSISSSAQTQSMMMTSKGERFSFTEDRSSGPGLVSSTLTILNLEAADSGKSFVCYAENSAGIASKAFTVTVLNMSGSVVGAWSKTEVAGGIILAVIVIVIVFTAVVIFITKSKRFKDSNSSAGSTRKAKHHPTDNGSAGSSHSSTSTNSHKSTASTAGSFPTIDVLKHVPVTQTPSPLGSKEMLETNGHIIGYNNFSQGVHQQHLHHHPLHASHFNHLHHVHPYSSHDPAEIMLTDSGIIHPQLQQQLHPASHAAFVSTSHVSTYGGEQFIDGNSFPQQYHQQQSFYRDQTPSHPMFSSNDEVSRHQEMQQSLYGGHPTIASAVITSTSSNSLNQNYNNSSNNINNERGEDTLNPETIPVSGTCVICDQVFTDLRFHYMDFHEIRECIV